MSNPVPPPNPNGNGPAFFVPEDWSSYSLPHKIVALAGIATVAIPETLFKFVHTKLADIHKVTRERITGPVSAVADRVFNWTAEKFGSSAANSLRNVVEGAFNEWNALAYGSAGGLDDHDIGVPTAEMITALAIETLVEVAILALSEAVSRAGSLIERVRATPPGESLAPVVDTVTSVASKVFNTALDNVDAFGVAPVKDLLNVANRLVEDKVLNPALGALNWLMGRGKEEGADPVPSN